MIHRIPPHKRIASLFLLPGCDMRCPFCASETDFSVMSFDDAAELLRDLRATPIDNIVLGGGEPFLWPHDVTRLARYAHELGFLVQVCTNGNGLPDDFARIPGIDRYILPLEALEAGIHDRLRPYRGGHYALVLQRIRALAGSGRSLSISTVVTRDNIDELPKIARFLDGVMASGVALHAWHLYRFVPVGRGGAQNAARLGVDKVAYRRACAAVAREARGFRVYRRDNLLRSSSVEFLWVERGSIRCGSDALQAECLTRRGAG